MCILIDMEFLNAAKYFNSYKRLEKSYIDFQLNALQEFDLSPNEIVVLSSLEYLDTASEIALESDVSKALVSRSVKLLKEKKYITVTLSENDKREQKLAWTEEGKKIAELIDQANRRFYATAFANFDQNEMDVLSALLKMMMMNLNIGGYDEFR